MSSPATIAVARNAMATRFEILLHGKNEVSLRAAGEEALNEIDRMESRLSLYRVTSEIAHVNARAAYEPVRVTPIVFKILQQAKALSAETGGAFDITIAPLVKCWGFMGGTGRMPEAADVEAARVRIGMSLVHLDANDFTVQFEREGVMLDLGAIGKGFALERAADLLREMEIESALLHGGTSTIQTIGHPPDAEHWKIAIEYPNVTDANAPQELVATVLLKDEAVSVSAIWGRAFKADGKTFGHVIDPRTGQPVMGAMLTAVALPSATETDALSTALLVLGESSQETIMKLRLGMRTLVMTQDDAMEKGCRISNRGI